MTLETWPEWRTGFCSQYVIIILCNNNIIYANYYYQSGGDRLCKAKHININVWPSILMGMT